MPQTYGTYYEPFLGGGSLLLDLQPKKAVVNDCNEELINMYLQVQHEQAADKRVFYYAIRDAFNQALHTNTPQQAARMIYLNKHCFNGLYRVNKAGLFNVPFNNKITGSSFDEKNMQQVSAYLSNVHILQGDFETAVATAQRGDFVFFDSPYDLVSSTSFTDYTKDGFSYEDHLRLHDLYERLSRRGVYCMLTNHNTELINRLYCSHSITVVPVSRSINSKGSERKGEEVIIKNF